jgi:hypothetical protein
MGLMMRVYRGVGEMGRREDGVLRLWQSLEGLVRKWRGGDAWWRLRIPL